MFDVFDAGTEHGRLYLALVGEPGGSVRSLAERADLPEQVVQDLLAELRQAGVAVPLDAAGERWDAARPDLVVAAALREHEDRRARLYRAEASLMEVFRFARLQSTDVRDVELVHGREATFTRFRKFQESAGSEVRAIDRPPYYWDAAEINRQEVLQCEQMAAGVSYRTIYQESMNDSPIRNASMMRTITHGENARVLTDPPIKLTIVDDTMALLALDPPAGAEGSLVAQFVYRSGLLIALTNIFESLWRLAVPINLARLNQALSERERKILTMMASGATDDAIARRLGLSRRTVVREVGRLLEQLGAATRFQAGAQAARRGWL